jgi:hypothetical protein
MILHGLVQERRARPVASWWNGIAQRAIILRVTGRRLVIIGLRLSDRMVVWFNRLIWIDGLYWHVGERNWERSSSPRPLESQSS